MTPAAFIIYLLCIIVGTCGCYAIAAWILRKPDYLPDDLTDGETFVPTLTAPRAD